MAKKEWSIEEELALSEKHGEMLLEVAKNSGYIFSDHYRDHLAWEASMIYSSAAYKARKNGKEMEANTFDFLENEALMVREEIKKEWMENMKEREN